MLCVVSFFASVSISDPHPVCSCEQEVDECKSNPCLNGGYCRNLINKYHCVCEMSFAGDNCQVDVSDIYFYMAVLFWQNLFQLISYLILNLDDDPVIDWGGQDD